jgi:hypothetical protein
MASPRIRFGRQIPLTCSDTEEEEEEEVEVDTEEEEDDEEEEPYGEEPVILPAARGGGVSVVDMVAAALRRSLLLCSSVRAEEGGGAAAQAAAAGMQIGRPTEVRHVSHVTFDRFVGFLGLPADLEPEVPRPAPSARSVRRSATRVPPCSRFADDFAAELCYCWWIKLNFALSGSSLSNLSLSRDVQLVSPPNREKSARNALLRH